MKKILTIFILLNGINSFSQEIKPKCLDGNCKNKIGTYIYSDSSIYVGSFVDKLRSGQGKITFKNKSTYDGQWLNDKRNGIGVYIDSVGNKYEGLWVDDKENGAGKYTDTKGNVYEGTWTNGALKGFITLRYKNKNLYEGEYDNGIRGKGKFSYADGSIYSGNFAKNKRSGYGEMVYSFGLTYKGNWVTNEVDGQGQFYLTSTQVKIAEGVWKTDKSIPNDTKFISSDGLMVCYYANKNLYYGKSQEGLPNSSGTMNYSNGDVYDGNFVKGVYHGKGKLTSKDKTEYNGNWKSGKKDGYGTQTNPDKSIFIGYWNSDKYIGTEKSIDLVSFISCPESCSSNTMSSSFMNADKLIGNCVNNLKEGEWKDIDENGRVVRISHFVNGILEGKQTTYYPNGKIQESKVFKNGLLNGQYFSYYDNGKISEKCKYNNGILVDTAYSFDFSENQNYYLNKVLIFNNSLEYYMKGDLVYNEHPFGRHNELSAHCIYYFPNGKIEEEFSVFERDIFGNYKKYDDRGNLIADLQYTTLNYVRLFDMEKIVSGWQMKEKEYSTSDNYLEKITYQNEQKSKEFITNDLWNENGLHMTVEGTINYENGKIRTIESPYYKLKVTYLDENSNDEYTRQSLIKLFRIDRELGSQITLDYQFQVLLMNLGKFKIECNYSVNNLNYSIKRYLLDDFILDSIYRNKSLSDVISLSSENELSIKHFYPNGNIEFSCNYVGYDEMYCTKKSDYVHFVSNGELVRYFDSGKVKMSVTLDNGEIIGNIILFDENGNMRKYTEEDYQNVTESDYQILLGIIRQKRMIL